MCKQHAASVGGVAHYCPPHDRASRLPTPPKPATSNECPHSWYLPGCKCGLPPVGSPDPEAAE